MKKSLLPILLGVIIGGSLIVALVCLSVLQSSLDKKTVAEAPVVNNKVVTSTEVTKLDEVFAKVMAGYKPERYYETDSAIWVGARSGLNRFSRAENDLGAQTLNLWRLSKSDWMPQFIGRFEAGGCDSVSWGLRGGEIVVTHTGSPCEAGVIETQYIYREDGDQKLKVVNSSFDEKLVFTIDNTAYEYTVELVNDIDCTQIPFEEDSEKSQELWNNPPSTAITQLLFSEQVVGQKKNTRTLTFSKRIPSSCRGVYGGGFDNPGIFGVDYKNGNLSFSNGGTTTTIFLDKVDSIFDSEGLHPITNAIRVEGNTLK